MAKKKTKKKVGATHKKKKVGAVSPLETIVLQAVGGVGGGIAASFLANMADTALGSQISPWITRAGIAAGGTVVAYAGRKNALLTGVGIGITTVGGVMTANELGLNVPGIAGIPLTAVGAARSHSRRKINGPLRSVGAPIQSVGQPNGNQRLQAIGALFSN